MEKSVKCVGPNIRRRVVSAAQKQIQVGYRKKNKFNLRIAVKNYVGSVDQKLQV